MKTIKIKNSLKSKIKDFIFNSTMIKADISVSKRILINIDDIRKILPKSFLIFNLKDFIFFKYIFKVYILADIKRNYKKSRFI